MRSRVPTTTLVALAAAIAAFTGCSKGEAEAADTTTAIALGADTAAAEPRSNVSLPVAAAEVRDGDLVLSVTTTGQVRSDAEATLKAELAGTIEEVLVRPGDHVRRGQPLVRLDGRPFDLAVREAEAGVEEAKLRFLEEIVPESLASGKGPSPPSRRPACRVPKSGSRRRSSIASEPPSSLRSTASSTGCRSRRANGCRADRKSRKW
jgi:hypothetical protein